ncbi:MAG: T9SS type A sorting domain-containing protein [Saprospiraceae bacterium]|nr:T9SS type A sorting domain-containing protein [Saprospiraceae bacterium]
MKNNIILIFVSFLNLNYLISQEFQFRGSNLYNLEFIAKDSSRAAIRSLFYDLDADGDQDAIIVGIDKVDSVKNVAFSNIHYFMEIQENIGDRWHASFKTRQPFMNNFPFPNGYFYPTIGDLNSDRMPDFIVSSGVDSFLNLQTMYYERKSISGADQFNFISTDSLKLNSFVAGSFFIPELADMDMDGDLDIMMSGFISEIDTSGENIQKPTFFYAKNIGTITKPKFLGWYPNPYGLAGAIDQNQLSTIGDIDSDNDNDILSLTSYDTFKVLIFLQNNHLPDGKPNFDNFSSLLGLPVAGKQESLYPPSLVDIDGDGDMDVFIVQDLISSGTGIGFYENLICNETLDNTISQAGSILKANLSGVKYQWYDCTSGSDIAGATAQSYQPIKSGKYAVKLDNNKGCESISTCYNFVLSATADQIISNQVSIYPNPTNDYVTIRNNSECALGHIIFRNNMGQIIKIVKPDANEKIWTADLPEGMYNVEITVGQWKVTKSLVIGNSGK